MAAACCSDTLPAAKLIASILNSGLSSPAPATAVLTDRTTTSRADSRYEKALNIIITHYLTESGNRCDTNTHLYPPTRIAVHAGLIGLPIITVGHFITGYPFVILNIMPDITAGFGAILNVISTMRMVTADIIANRSPQHPPDNSANFFIILSGTQPVPYRPADNTAKYRPGVGLSLMT